MTAVTRYTAGDFKTLLPRVSWEQFERDYLTKEDGWKYEWIDGYVEKTQKTMNQYQAVIATNLTILFHKLLAAGKVNGILMAEIDTFLEETKFRIPDLAYYTFAQLEKMEQKENQIPEFVIELISKNDNINAVRRKIEHYLTAGVKVIWLIYSDLQIVDVYIGNSSTAYQNEDVCSAAPVLPEFKMKVKEMFGKPGF